MNVFGLSSIWVQSKEIRNAGAVKDAILFAGDKAARPGGMVEADFGLNLDGRNRLIVERERNAGQVLPGASGITKSQRATGSIHTVFITEIFRAHGDANLLGEVVSRPKTHGPHRRVACGRGAGRVEEIEVVQLRAETQLILRLPAPQQGPTPQGLNEAGILAPAKRKEAKPELFHRFDADRSHDGLGRVV